MSLARGQLPESDEIKKLRARVDNSFENYRKSGLALMATVIAISSGGLVMLIQNKSDSVGEWAFLFLVPISLSILQQLFYYFGSKEMAHLNRENLSLQFETDNETLMNTLIRQYKYFRHSNLCFGISDSLSWISCLSLGIIAICLLTMLTRPIVVIVIGLFILTVLVYWWRQSVNLKKEIASKDYTE
jgi:hypothetical protein